MHARSLRSMLNVGVRRSLAARLSILTPLVVLVLAFCTPTPIAAQQSEDVLSNEAIVRMTRAGLEDATILKLIATGRTEFDTSAAALIALKDAGVSNRVIDAMVSAPPAKAATTAGLYPQPEETGVFANVRERLSPLKIEIITWRSGGALKQTLTLSRGHLNGQIIKPMSALRLASPVEFIVYCPEGVSAEEYQLLRFWEKKDRREFRISTGGVIHKTTGAELNTVKLDIERLGPRLYRIKPAYPLQKGEYGFLPPGAAFSASAASGGKMFTFGVTGAR